jgi:hypothetical protein
VSLVDSILTVLGLFLLLQESLLVQEERIHILITQRGLFFDLSPAISVLALLKLGVNVR